MPYLIKSKLKMKAVMFLKSNNKHQIAIDCANVACQYVYNLNNLGSNSTKRVVDAGVCGTQSSC